MNMLLSPTSSRSVRFRSDQTRYVDLPTRRTAHDQIKLCRRNVHPQIAGSPDSVLSSKNDVVSREYSVNMRRRGLGLFTELAPGAYLCVAEADLQGHTDDARC